MRYHDATLLLLPLIFINCSVISFSKYLVNENKALSNFFSSYTRNWNNMNRVIQIPQSSMRCCTTKVSLFWVKLTSKNSVFVGISWLPLGGHAGIIKTLRRINKTFIERG